MPTFEGQRSAKLLLTDLLQKDFAHTSEQR
jgi:hypothetical protein